jgi:hypothetical protein
MQSTIRLRAVGVGVLGAVAVVLLYVALMGSASKSAATVSPYCGNQTMGAGATCAGAARNLSGVNGWGDQHSVCVGTAETGGPTACSGGPGAGVTQNYGGFAVRTPLIKNNGGSANTVHGVAFTP